LAFALVLLLACLSQTPAQAVPQSQVEDLATAPVTNLSRSSSIVSRYADITADCAGNVHVVWVEEDGGDSSLHSANYAMWDGSGVESTASMLSRPEAVGIRQPRYREQWH
jgi:hypothetical protein